MHKHNTKRTLFIGIVAGLLVFGWWLRGFLFMNWRFSLFSPKSWRFLMHEFDSGWQIHTIGDWIFLISFILSIPLFIWCWILMNKVNWTKLFKRCVRWIKKTIRGIGHTLNFIIWPFLSKKRKRLKKIKRAQKNKRPTVIQRATSVQRPRAMPTTPATHRTLPSMMPTGGFMNNAPMGGFTPSDNASFMHSAPIMDTPAAEPQNFTPTEFQEMAQTPLSDIQLPEIEKVDENLPEIFTNMGYRLLPNGTFANQTTHLLALSTKQLLLIYMDEIAGDWLADEEAFNDEDPLWFSETDHRVSPIFTLIQQAKEVKSKLSSDLSEIKIQPVYMTTKTNIINAEDMMKTWRDLGVVVCRTQTGGPVQLSTVTETFKEKQDIPDDILIQQVIEALMLKETTNG